MASNNSKAALLRAANAYRHAKHDHFNQRKNKASRLLTAARAWRESARDNAQARGLREKPRPAFTSPPQALDPQRPPPSNIYIRTLLYWASCYAWNAADRADTREPIRHLLRTADVGPAVTFQRRLPTRKTTQTPAASEPSPSTA